MVILLLIQTVSARLLYADRGQLLCVRGPCDVYPVEIVNCTGGDWDLPSESFSNNLTCTVVSKYHPLMVFIPIGYKCDDYLALVYDYPCQLVYVVDTLTNPYLIASLLAENLILISFILTMAIGLAWSYQVVCSKKDDSSSSDEDDEAYKEMA